MTALSEAIHTVVELPGAVAGALVDMESGNCLVRVGREDLFSLTAVAVATAQTLRTEMRLVQEQFPQESMEDCVITVGRYYHLIRLIHNGDTAARLFLCLVLKRDSANLVMTRRKMAELERQIICIQESQGTDEIAQFAAMLRNSVSTATPELKVKLEMSGDEDDEEELPPFMRQETVMKLLGMAEESYRKVAG